MAFTGKATYSGGAALPEIADDLSDLIGIVSPYETPLLDLLGDPQRAAMSTHHEWLEDSLLPNTDAITTGPVDPDGGTTLNVANASRFRVGDQARIDGSAELLLVLAVDTGAGTIDVVRGYGGTTPEDITDSQAVIILGNAALEGDEADAARFTVRQRRGNWTQIFTRTVHVSGSDLAVRHHSVADELDYQKQERLRELLRDLENTVINGAAPAADAQGGDAVRRTMNGLVASLATNVFEPGVAGIPVGPDLDETMLNACLRRIWETSSAQIDTLVVNGFQKRQISAFNDSVQVVADDEAVYRNTVSTYESDFGVQRVVLSRWMPRDAVLMLDSSRIGVLPLSGRSFHYKPLAATGDFEKGVIIGEYTLEMRNEQAHGLLRGLQIT